MALIAPSLARTARHPAKSPSSSGSGPHILLADPDLVRARRCAADLQEFGWRCEVAASIWEAIGLVEALRFTHLVAHLRQMGPDDLGGMLLAWTWLRSGRSRPVVLGSAPELHGDPSILERRIVLLPDTATPADLRIHLGGGPSSR